MPVSSAKAFDLVWANKMLPLVVSALIGVSRSAPGALRLTLTASPQMMLAASYGHTGLTLCPVVPVLTQRPKAEDVKCADAARMGSL